MKQKSALSGLKIAVIGAGNMGAALVRGLVEKSVYPQNISVFDIDRKKLEGLKKDLAGLQSQFKDNYPDIIALKRRISATERRVAVRSAVSEPAGQTQSTLPQEGSR